MFPIALKVPHDLWIMVKKIVTLENDTFEIFGKCSESVGFDTNNGFQEELKIFKSGTFENYKRFYLKNFRTYV